MRLCHFGTGENKIYLVVRVALFCGVICLIIAQTSAVLRYPSKYFSYKKGQENWSPMKWLPEELTTIVLATLEVFFQEM